MNEEKKAPPRCQPGTGDVKSSQVEVTSSGQDGKRPFIPAWLDDAGLSQAEFRLYCHLWRRADRNGIAWPSVDGNGDDGNPSTKSIVSVCGMARRTAWKTINRLIELKLIEKLGKRHFQSSNTYRVLSPIGAIEAPIEASTVSLEAPVITPPTGAIGTPVGEPTGAIEAPPIGANGTLQPAQSRPQEGTPKKVLQGRESNKDRSSPGFLPLDDAAPEKTSIADDLWAATPARGKERSSKKQLSDALKKIPKAQMPTAGQLLNAVEAWKSSEAWTSAGGQFIPGIHRWVNDRKWETLPATLPKLDLGGRKAGELIRVGPDGEAIVTSSHGATSPPGRILEWETDEFHKRKLTP